MVDRRFLAGNEVSDVDGYPNVNPFTLCIDSRHRLNISGTTASFPPAMAARWCPGATAMAVGEVTSHGKGTHMLPIFL